MVVWPGDNVSLQAEAQQLANDLRYIQFLSMSQDSSYRVNFSSDQYTFTDLSGVSALLHPVTESNIATLGTGMILSTTGLPNNYLVFDQQGIPYTDTVGTELSSNATITLTASSGSIAVTVSPETGLATIS